MNGTAAAPFLVALGNRRDQYHEWAHGGAEQITPPLLTCEPVLAEAAFHLQNTALVLAMVRDGLVEVAFECREHWPQLDALAERYADRAPDLADLCLIRMSELYPHHTVVTVDREDFTVYRRNKREVIPTLFPRNRERRGGRSNAPLRFLPFLADHSHQELSRSRSGVSGRQPSGEPSRCRSR